MLKFPADGASAQTKKNILLTWGVLSAADSFEVQVASDREFRDLVHTEKTDENFIRFSFPKSGVYYWRVHELRLEVYSDPHEIRIL